MTAKEKSFTEPMQCGHCENKAPMEIVSSHSQVESFEEQNTHWEAGLYFQLAECPACRGVTLRKQMYHDGYDWNDVTWTILYPSPKELPRGLPSDIQKALRAANRVKNIDANAHAVLLRRVLELVCKDRNAHGKDLNDKLADLALKGEIPTKLVDVAKGLRRLSNVGAHAELGELTSAETPIVEDLSRAVLDYVYTAPYLAAQAETRLKQLKSGSGQD